MTGTAQKHLHGTVDEALDSAVTTILEGTDTAPTAKQFTDLEREKFRHRIRENTEQIINVLLYMAGEDDITERVGDYPAPFKRHERALEGTPHEEALQKSPSEADVGLRMQKALRQYKGQEGRESPRDKQDRQEEGTEDEESEGAKKRPHIRRPHPHLYWTGEDREIPRVKYLGPIAVNMEDPSEGDVPPTKQPVEGEGT